MEEKIYCCRFALSLLLEIFSLFFSLSCDVVHPSCHKSPQVPTLIVHFSRHIGPVQSYRDNPAIVAFVGYMIIYI